MKKLQESDLRKILSRKLEDFEANVPDQADDFVLGKLASQAGSAKLKRQAIRSALIGALVIVPVLFFPLLIGDQKDKGDSSVQVQAKPTSPAQPRVEGRLPETTTISPSLDQRQRKVRLAEMVMVNDNATSSIPDVIEKPGMDDKALNAVASSTQRVASDSVTEEINVPASATENAKSTQDTLQQAPAKSGRFRLTVGLAPFLSYNRLQPNRSDGVQLSNFVTPSSFSAQRIGYRFSAGTEYEIRPDRFLVLGIAYTQYKTTFQYSSNELIQGVSLSNAVDNRVQALGLYAGIKHPLYSTARHKRYLVAGVDGQMLLGTDLAAKNLYNLNLGYTQQFNAMGRGFFTLTPMVSYSLTRFRYGGVVAQPFWIGVQGGWVFTR